MADTHGVHQGVDPADSDLACPASRAMFSGRATLVGTATACPPPNVIPAFIASSSLARRAARTVQPLRASLMASPCRKPPCRKKKGQ
jgi:hypothetical protein